MGSSEIIRSPQALACMQRGFEHMAALLAHTLGPREAVVLSSRGRRAPERLVDGGTIARRVVAIPERGADTGAMVARNLAWTMHERYGDGAATAAVLAQAILRRAARSVAAGANPMALRRGIERGCAAASAALAAQALPASGQDVLTRLATSATGDAELGAVLGELCDVLGPGAAYQVDEFAAPYLDRAYLEGGRWWARPAARGMLPEGHGELTLESPLVAVADQRLDRVGHVRAILELAAQAPGKPPLLLVAREIAGEALNTLTVNHARGAIVIGAAVLTGATPHQTDDLADVAALTGADVLADILGRPPGAMRPTAFGRVGRVTLTRERLTVIGGGGDPAARQRRAGELRARAARLPAASEERDRLRLRAARLAGGIGVVKVGAHTPAERARKKELARKALLALERAQEEGLVPGGGAAYRACAPAVRAAYEACRDEDEAAGIMSILTALDAPMAQIIRNHGAAEVPVVLRAADERGEGYGFDAASGELALMAEAGVLDPLAVARGALDAAASAAMTLVTTDVLVLNGARRGVRLRP